MCDKKRIREQLKKIRESFRGVQRDTADKLIAEKFLFEFKDFESFFIYNSFSSEADTSRIITALLKAGKRVYLPRVEGDKLVAVPYGETHKGAYGIEEPDGQAYEKDIDVTVIPLLAVNEKLFRIGYGKGYYDRYLKDRRTKKVGLGYGFQITEFKEDEWDIPLDFYLCEKGIYGK